jgi:hypothetical protein
MKYITFIPILLWGALGGTRTPNLLIRRQSSQVFVSIPSILVRWSGFHYKRVSVIAIFVMLIGISVAESILLLKGGVSGRFISSTAPTPFFSAVYSKKVVAVSNLCNLWWSCSILYNQYLASPHKLVTHE